MANQNIILCDVCQSRDAEVFLTQIVEGKMQKVNLCKECSKDRGVEDPTGFALTELLAGLGTSTETEKPVPAPGSAPLVGDTISGPSMALTTTSATKCPVCGFTQADFKKTGRLGCSACYQTFAESLSNLLRAMHKGTAHLGKMPSNLVRRREHAERLRGLQADLKKAVEAENYENAASLRDQIKKLAGQMED
jgi:protein arginine kinase activator